MKAYYLLSGLQEVSMRKLASEYTTPNFTVKVRKNGKLEKGFYTGGDRFSVEWEGYNGPDSMRFIKALRENNSKEGIKECTYTL